MDLFRAAYNGRREAKRPPPSHHHHPKICHTYPTMKELGSYTVLKKDPKNINHATHLLSCGSLSMFSLEFSATFIISRNTDIHQILIHSF